MAKSFLKILVAALFLVMLPDAVSAQCRNFTKGKCMPELTPYINNGQINSVVLYAGEQAEVEMTFYSGQEYRLLCCYHPILGDNVYFEVKDAQGNIIYSGKDKSNKYWDFKVESTQQLTVVVSVPTEKSNVNLPQSGCVSVLVGFKG